MIAPIIFLFVAVDASQKYTIWIWTMNFFLPLSFTLILYVASHEWKCNFLSFSLYLALLRCRVLVFILTEIFCLRASTPAVAIQSIILSLVVANRTKFKSKCKQNLKESKSVFARLKSRTDVLPAFLHHMIERFYFELLSVLQIYFKRRLNEPIGQRALQYCLHEMDPRIKIKSDMRFTFFQDAMVLIPISLHFQLFFSNHFEMFYGKWESEDETGPQFQWNYEM